MVACRQYGMQSVVLDTTHVVSINLMENEDGNWAANYWQMPSTNVPGSLFFETLPRCAGSYLTSAM